MKYLIGVLLGLSVNVAFCSLCDNLGVFLKTSAYDELVVKGIEKVVQNKLAHLVDPAQVSIVALPFTFAPSKNKTKGCLDSEHRFRFRKGYIAVNGKQELGISTYVDESSGCVKLSRNKVYDSLGRNTGKTRCEISISYLDTDIYNLSSVIDLAFITKDDEFIFDADML